MLVWGYMPDVTSDERGRRIFQLHKEKAVESALEKIRHNPSSGWTTLSPEEMKTLTFILGETWVSVERSIWEQCSFSRLTGKDLEEIIRIGNAVHNNTIREETGVNKVSVILKGLI